ncbi:unnamed protein product [Cylindrotheca closterium]|uniref:Uncharacterized protein n=1 Tax=Cylindrotheca closterium TaxID=2856 RepID=A0AAD2CFK7_9STRA|nr:unnamed protein product [Cylindrotheca closterium]
MTSFSPTYDHLEANIKQYLPDQITPNDYSRCLRRMHNSVTDIQRREFEAVVPKLKAFQDKAGKLLHYTSWQLEDELKKLNSMDEAFRSQKELLEQNQRGFEVGASMVVGQIEEVQKELEQLKQDLCIYKENMAVNQSKIVHCECNLSDNDKQVSVVQGVKHFRPENSHLENSNLFLTQQYLIGHKAGVFSDIFRSWKWDQLQKAARKLQSLGLSTNEQFLAITKHTPAFERKYGYVQTVSNVRVKGGRLDEAKVKFAAMLGLAIEECPVLLSYLKGDSPSPDFGQIEVQAAGYLQPPSGHKQLQSPSTWVANGMLSTPGNNATALTPGRTDGEKSIQDLAKEIESLTAKKRELERQQEISPSKTKRRRVSTSSYHTSPLGQRNLSPSFQNSAGDRDVTGA